MNKVGYYNGVMGPLEEMTIPMNDRCSYFGDGVYDVTMAENGVLFGAQEHYDRFYNSCRLLEIPFKMEREKLNEEIFRCIDACDWAGKKFVYWAATRGTGDRNHLFPKCEPNLMIFVRPIGEMNPFEKYRLITAEDVRFELCHIKTLNLIPSVIASQRAFEKGCDEAVFHRGNIVTECAHCNVHIIKNGVFRTHEADRFILPGIARKHLLELCAECGIPTEEKAFTLEELFDADEVLVSASTIFFHSASEIDGKSVGGKAPDILNILREAYFKKYKAATNCSYWEDKK